MPTTTREIWWLTALEATLFFSLPFWEITAAYAEPTTYPLRFAAAVLFAATAATLIFHIAPAFLSTKHIHIPTIVAVCLALGYTERILVATRHGNAPWLCLAIILILAVTYQACARLFTIAALAVSVGLLIWAVVTTWPGHSAQNPRYSSPPEQLDGLLIQGMLVSAAPAVLIARQIGQLAPTRAFIWKTGLFGIYLPMLISVTAASLAAQAGATLHWHPTLFRSFSWALTGYFQFAAYTLLGPAILSALALRSIAPNWQGRQRLWHLPLAAALIITAAASHAWHPISLVNELAVPAYHLWALTIAILLILAILRRPSISILAITLLSLPLQAQPPLHGQITDKTGAGIAAVIRVLQPRTNTVIQQFSAKDDGSFQTSPLPPGVYSLTAYAPGFRRHEWHNVVISANQSADLGTVALELAGCDAPGVNCDYIGPAPDEGKRFVTQAYVTLKPSCAADLDRKPPGDCAAEARNTDISLIQQNNTLYLTPTNGATISPTNSDCSSTAFTSNKLPVSGLGQGVDFCIRTNKGALSHVFFVNDIDNQSTSVKLWYVTRKRR